MTFTPASILAVIAVAIFLLAAFGIAFGTVELLPLGLAFFAAAFVFAGQPGWRR